MCARQEKINTERRKYRARLTVHIPMEEIELTGDTNSTEERRKKFLFADWNLAYRTHEKRTHTQKKKQIECFRVKKIYMYKVEEFLLKTANKRKKH